MDGGLRAAIRHVWPGRPLANWGTAQGFCLRGCMSRCFEDHDPIGVVDRWFGVSVSIRSGAGKRKQGGDGAAWGLPHGIGPFPLSIAANPLAEAWPPPINP
ncbi:hypothetical protein Sala_2500 [Sphingopyxis alaskensis RB2256]|uniref:Uncharacterized protein n=1 Tax=Sphingopyxis alaskensis (strain DSM 13593 / LMG 18877 / RB2256) TaxID=317655 RepID=Q1GQ65_SPHAL|nr:hypothetical protein Sala_2500 [Sphingopyxis alaskensis RB2256]